MEQAAKNLLKRISEVVESITSRKATPVTHAPKYNEWRAYLCQAKPRTHWEDIAWRVKEPNLSGMAEVHLGIYSAKTVDGLSEAIEKIEALGKGIVSHVIKRESGISLVWNVRLNNSSEIDKLFDQIKGIIPQFLEIALQVVCKNNPGISDNNEEEDDDSMPLTYAEDTNFQIEEISIGNQIWMKQNLNVDRFRNGDLIPEAKTAEEWAEAGRNQQPAFCHFENKPENGEIYGKLYNWFAVNDPRQLAPMGWSITTEEDWETLVQFLGGDDDNTIQLKLKNQTGWESLPGFGGFSEQENGINSSGFSALPAGERSWLGDFNQSTTGWWTNNDRGDGDAGAVTMDYYLNSCGPYSKEEGKAVRCIKE